MRAETTPPELSPAVRRVVDCLEAADVRTRTTELYVPVMETILDTAADVDADLIVLGGRKRSPADKALFGSVTQSVILESTVPVVVVG